MHLEAVGNHCCVSQPHVSNRQCAEGGIVAEEFGLHLSKTEEAKSNLKFIFDPSNLMQTNCEVYQRWMCKADSFSRSMFFSFFIFSLASVFKERLPSVAEKKIQLTNEWEKRRSVPGQEDTLHHREVLHENVPVWFGAQVAHSVADAQLDGSFQGRCCGLTKSHNRTILSFNFKREINNIFQKCRYIEMKNLDCQQVV